MLSADETARGARFGPAALRERYIIGRGTLRGLLSDALGVPPAEIAIVRGRRGRPQVKDIPGVDFNVSHTRDIAVYAIGLGLPAEIRLGIDVEHVDRAIDADRVARKILTEHERGRWSSLSPDARRIAFVTTWTCKEAMSKATGDGLSAPFGKISIEDGDPPRVVDGPARYGPAYWRLHRAMLPPGYVVTVAVHTSPGEPMR
ncbi:MAG TPA: 4'-phosphopantetheinyl transferase superfamily protein [Casimicrobiaceae bacterium]|nr:4'-phosphopantetheinyl transferase superfamily protein [Casimicrobiaceae bacterium]